MSNISITLPDGSSQSVNAGTRPIDIARAISPRLARRRRVGPCNGQFFDLTRPLEADATLQILTSKNPRRSKSTATRRPPAGRGKCSNLPRNQTRSRAAHRYRLLL